MFSTKTKVGLLVAGHLVAGILVAAFCHENKIFPHPVTVVFLALTLADAGLLGIWLALGGGRWWKRFGVILASTIYVGWLGWLISGNVSLVIFFDLPITLVAIGLAVFRRKGLKIAVLSPLAAEGLQFSISHLLGSTALVAVLLAVGREFRANTAESRPTAMNVLIAVIINGSLLIVRSCGYRLVRSTEGSA